MAWEKCPLCSGSGKIHEDSTTTSMCPVCKGKRIIHQVTGVPPGEPMKKSEVKDVSIDDKAFEEIRRKILEEAQRRADKRKHPTWPFYYPDKTYDPRFGRFGPIIVGLRGTEPNPFLVPLTVGDIIV